MSVRQLRTSVPRRDVMAIPYEAAGARIHGNADMFRPAKVRTARRRLAAGKYDGSGLLDVVLERVLADIAFGRK